MMLSSRLPIFIHGQVELYFSFLLFSSHFAYSGDERAEAIGMFSVAAAAALNVNVLLGLE